MSASPLKPEVRAAYPSQRGPEGAVSKSSLLFSAPEQSRGQLSIDRNCLVPRPRSAEEREMANSAQIAANRLNAQESTVRHSPAELRSTAPQPPRGRSREKS